MPRAKRKGDWLELPVLTGAVVGFLTGWQWPGEGMEKVYTGAAGAFITTVVVLALTFWLRRKKKKPGESAS
ncbi:MAG TPA: hypothetical protein VFB08_19315 [Burkholderiales bacterium]|nr:hypothetical protein [Burkholderiales bacterium]